MRLLEVEQGGSVWIEMEFECDLCAQVVANRRRTRVKVPLSVLLTCCTSTESPVSMKPMRLNS